MRGAFDILQALGLPMPMGVLQVGANTGQEIDEFLRNGIRRAVLIEPLPGPYSILEARCRDIPGDLPVQALCGALDGEVVEFHVATNNGESSSILRPAKHLTDFLRLYGIEIYELEMNAAGWGNAMFIKQGLFSAAQT
jgi:FkbM family methyltransferase